LAGGGGRSVGGGHEKQFLIITVPLGHFAIQEKQQQLIWSGIACISLLPVTETGQSANFLTERNHFNYFSLVTVKKIDNYFH
jgi:hypothetical protein